MAEDIILRYRAETDDLTKELNLIIEQQEKLEQSADKTSKDVQKSVSVEATALKQRQQLIEKELQTITKLQAARARASDPRIIERYNQAIAQSERNIRSLKSATEKAATDITKTFNTAGSSIKNIGLSIASGFAAAFSVQAVIQFARSSVDAFIQAEKSAEALRNAVIGISGESEKAFNRLIKQSKELQDITIFSDEDVQQAQAALSAFDLTADQIEELLPLLADFATVTGTDLVTAAQRVGAGLEGQGREFKKYQIEVSATKSRVENLNSILTGFARFQGSAAKATETAAGQIAQQRNAVDDLQESIGQKLLPTFLKLQQAGLRFVQFFADLFGEETVSDFDRMRDALQKTNIEAQTSIEVLISGNLPLDQRKTLIDEINTQYGEYLPNLITEQTTTKELIEIQKELNENILDRIKLMALEERIAEITERAVSAARNLIQVEKERAKLGNVTESQNAQLLKLRETQLGILSDVNRQILSDAPKLIAELQAQYNELFKSLGLNVKAVDNLDTTNDKLAESNERVANSLETINKLTPITSLSYQNLTEDQLRLLEVFKASTEGVGEFRDAVQKLNRELENDAISEFEEKLRKANEARREAGEAIEAAPLIEPIKEYADTWLGKNEEILQSSLNLFSQLSFLSNQLTEGRIQDLELQQERFNEQASEEERLLQDSLDKRIISEGEYEKKSEALRLKRVENEKKLQAAINKEKRKQALLDRINAVFEITINTAIAATKALATPPAPNVVLAALAGALGAAQLATALAAPIPAYAKGTKKAKGGMSLVGEQGAEVMYVPKDAKILPAQKTKNYGEVLDAMYDNRFDRFILDRYVAPALAEQKKRYENKQQETFASNIVNSMTVNGLTLGDVMYANKKGINIKNIDDLSKGVARELAPLLPTIDLRRI